LFCNEASDAGFQLNYVHFVFLTLESTGVHRADEGSCTGKAPRLDTAVQLFRREVSGVDKRFRSIKCSRYVMY
jgi:hypothetical protein